jgi:hypothetical protein
MKKWLLIILFAGFSGYGIAQDFNPAEAWLSYSVKHSLSKKWDIKGMAQWRPNNYELASNPYLLQVEARRKFSKRATLNMQYRYSFFDNERNTQRLAIDGRFKWKLGHKSNVLQYRSRLQVTRVNVNGQIISGWRNKIGFEKKINKQFALYADYENFVELIKITSFLRVKPPHFNKNRYTLGAKFKWGQHTLKTFYRLEKGIGGNDPVVHIVGLGITRKL